MSTVFSTESPGVLVHGFRYKTVEPHILPTGFEGTIVAEKIGVDSITSTNVFKKFVYKLDDGGGVVDILNDSAQIPPGHYSEHLSNKPSNASILPSFIYTIHDIPGLNDHVASRNSRQKEWDKYMKDTDEKLRLENEKYGDVVMVPMVDTYRNLPKKLLQFFKW